MGSHSVTCHPAELTFPPIPQPNLVLDLATLEECRAEFGVILTDARTCTWSILPTLVALGQQRFRLYLPGARFTKYLTIYHKIILSLSEDQLTIWN